MSLKCKMSLCLAPGNEEMLLKGPQLCRLLPFVSLFVDSGSCKYWLASGSNEFTVRVHDVGSMFGTCALS